MELEEVFRFAAAAGPQVRHRHRHLLERSYATDDGSGSGSDSDSDFSDTQDEYGRGHGRSRKELLGALNETQQPQPQRVQLNRKILVRGISSMHLQNQKELDNDVVLRKKFREISHLHLQNKKIDDLSSFGEFKNLTVLYLYNNNIDEIIGLESLYNLEVLDLHENKIDRIRGLQGCVNLQKLYLGQNRITMLEGLEKLRRLEELHVEYQNQEPATGQSLEFDPLSLHALSESLRMLNISGNHLESIEDLAGLGYLGTLIAKDNLLQELDQTVVILTTLPSIKKLDFRGNLMVKMPKYREKMIGNTNYIETLDGKDIPHTTRDFIQRFQRMKAAHLRRAVEVEQRALFQANAQARAQARISRTDRGQDFDPQSQDQGEYGDLRQTEPHPQSQSLPQPTIYCSGSVEDFANANAGHGPHLNRLRIPRPLASRHRQQQLKGLIAAGSMSTQSFPGAGAGSNNFGFPTFPNPRIAVSVSESRSRTVGTATAMTLVPVPVSKPRSPPPSPGVTVGVSRNASHHSQPGAIPQFMLTTPSNTLGQHQHQHYGNLRLAASSSTLPQMQLQPPNANRNRSSMILAARNASTPMLSAVNVNMSATTGTAGRKWLSALSPIPAGETEEEGDDEGDPDVKPQQWQGHDLFQRPVSPEPSFEDANVVIGGQSQGQGEHVYEPEPESESKARSPFKPNVYSLPPWPHIHHLGALEPPNEPVSTFIP